ncbi:MAG: SEC-C metal-binding domain-containing protein [Blastocatellia bacterium]
MKPYSEQTTGELIALLISEEDRVTREHILELAGRADAIEPLLDVVRNEYYWSVEGGGEVWIVMHAVTALCLSRDSAALPTLIELLPLPWKFHYDWLHTQLPAGLAQFGETAVEPLMDHIRQHQTDDDDTVTYHRSDAANALTRIALENHSVRERVLDFLCGVIDDPEEKDEEFLGFVLDDPVALDFERGMETARRAYERKAVDYFVSGDFNSFAQAMEQRQGEPFWELTLDILDFYSPDSIAKRQARWKKEAEEQAEWARRKEKEEAERARQNEEKASALKSSSPPPVEAARIPDGYSQGESGGLVRDEKVGRNDPCPCGSGKKYKKCCGANV